MKETLRQNLIAAAIFVGSLGLDVLTKHLVIANVPYGAHHDYLGGFLRITFTYNEGGVFGIYQGYKNVFLVISIIVLLLMAGYYFFEKNKTFLFSCAMACIMSGAVGNIIDRLIPSRPGVVDFISMGVDGVYRWPTYNIADSVIVAGAFLLVIVFYQDEKRRKQAHREATGN